MQSLCHQQGKRKKALKLLVQAEMRSSTSPAKKNPTTDSKLTNGRVKFEKTPLRVEFSQPRR
jgi:hypothetical protein